MRAICLASSSSGNAYVLIFGEGSEAQYLLIECGLPIRELRIRMLANNLKLSQMQACLVTHGHNDHAISIQDIVGMGINTYSSIDTFITHNVGGQFAKELKANEYAAILPDVTVLPFPVEHDAPGSLGFAIENNRTNERVLFVNDCKYYTINLYGMKFDYVFMECNHMPNQVHIVLDNAIKSNDFQNVVRYKRLVNSHMSLSGTNKALSKLDLKTVRAVFLMHLSDGYSNEYTMKADVAQANSLYNRVFVCGKQGGIK